MLDEIGDDPADFLAWVQDVCPGGFKLLGGIREGRVSTRINGTTGAWQRTYSANSYRYADPVIAWGLSRTGYRLWTGLDRPRPDDPSGFFLQAHGHGIVAMAGISVAGQGARSILELVSVLDDFAPSLLANFETRLAGLHPLFLRDHPRLTCAEAEALRLLAAGATIFEAAHAIGISESAVKLRLRGARKRLGVPTTLAAIHTAACRGLI